MNRLVALIILWTASAFAQTGQWQYALLGLPGTDDSSSSVEGTIDICYITDEGCRTDTVKVSEPYPAGFRRGMAATFTEARARNRVLAKAIAQLGRQGYEAVGQTRTGLSTLYTSPTDETQFLFKRPLAP